MDAPFPVTIPEPAPWVPAECPAPDTGPPSFCTIDSSGSQGITLWSWPTSRLTAESQLSVRLQIAPEYPAIIGRKQGGEIEYLDPRYVPSTIMPGSNKTILRHGGKERDTFVSRGHFMLRAHATGIVLVNGVPRRGGGIRPPLNWTYLLAPQRRVLAPAEELVIERGQFIQISLPNGTRLTIRAE